jgi:hypothetical protein
MNMGIEKWTDIYGTNGEYQISNFGRIRSWVQKGSRIIRLQKPYIMKTPLNGNGYPHTTILFSQLNKLKTIRIHKLVAYYFVPNPNNYKVVMHIDDNKLNAHYKNLKWGTSVQNNQDAFRNGLIIPAKGVNRNKSQLTEQNVRSIFKSKKTCRELAIKYKVNHTCISDIRSGRSWNHITGLLCTRKIKPKFSKDVRFVK